MSEEESTRYIQVIRQQIEVLRRQIVLNQTEQQQLLVEGIEEITVSLENLQLLQEQIQASLEVMRVIQEELLQQNKYLAEERQRYYDLFDYAPNAYLLTNTQGVILEANHAAGQLFKVSRNFLIGKPLVTFVAQTERSVFRTQLNQLSSIESGQEWEIKMCPSNGQSFDAIVMVVPVSEPFKSQGWLRISIHDVTKYKRTTLQRPIAGSELLPQAFNLRLDGLQVLFVDDEDDAREFITTVLEQQGISVTAVSSVDEAISVLERSQSCPDVLISDIRMPDEDGYSLIKKVRQIEAQKGWKIPAAALTAYLAEDQAKAIKAGFESHLHKLAEPTELVAMVARLAGRW